MTDNNLLYNNKIKRFDIYSQGGSRKGDTGRSRLTQDQKNQIRYWISLGCDLAACYSQEKNRYKEKWGENTSGEPDYNTRLEQGHYDDGVAIICGQLRRGPNKDKWISCFDFDSKEAFDTFFDIFGTTLEQLAKWTLVEWHGSPERIHVFFITNTPFKSIAAGGIEVKANKLLAFVSPSIHKSGEPYRAYDKFNISIQLIDNIKKQQIERAIEAFIRTRTNEERNYFDNEEEKNRYIEILEAEGTKLRAGERHPGTVAMASSMFFRRKGEWDNLSDAERYDKLVEWHKRTCVPSLFEERGREKELEKIWKDTCRKYTGRRQEERDTRENKSRQIEEQYKDVLAGLSEDKQRLFKSYNPVIQQALSGNIWVELERDEWIVANKQENVIYRSKAISRESESRDQLTKLFDKGPRLLKCIPTAITVYENPLDFLDQQLTYTITFRDTTKKSYTLTRKTLDQISDWLKNHGYILPTGRRGGTVIELLSAMVDAFREDGKLEVDNRISSMGIYHVDGKLTFIGCEEYIERYHKQTINQRQDAIKFIEELITKFRTGIVPTALKVGVISPFNFALKQYTNDVVFVRSLWDFGATRTGKTTITTIPNCMYFDKENDRKAPFTSVNSEARLGHFVSQDTFPASVYELKALNKDDPKATIMIEMLKAVIETKEARGTMNKQSTIKTKCPAFRQINFSSNPRPPNDPALSSRIIKQIFTDKDKHSQQQKKEFNRFMKDKHHLRTLGDFMIGYLYDNPMEIIFKEDKAEIDWEECAKESITKFYELSMKPRPSNWLDLPLTNQDDEDYETDETNNNIDSLRTALLSYFNEVYNKYIRRSKDDTTIMLATEDRIRFCVDNNLTPCFAIGTKGRLIISHGILGELEKHGIGSDRIGSLKEVAELLGLKHDQLKLNGRNTRCVYGNIQNLYDFVRVVDDNELRPFLDTSVEKESLESDSVTKTALHEAYKHFCITKKLAIMPLNQFEDTLKDLGFVDSRETTGKKYDVWNGIRLTKEYLEVIINFNGKQTTMPSLALDYQLFFELVQQR